MELALRRAGMRGSDAPVLKQEKMCCMHKNETLPCSTFLHDAINLEIFTFKTRSIGIMKSI